jgi:tetratricopeptide (TPR) repeat protein
VFFVWWKQGTPIPLPQRLTAPPFVAPPRPHFPSEEEWLVGQIGRQIAETAGFARTGKGPGALRLDLKVMRMWSTKERPEHYEFKTKLRGTELPVVELDLANYLWDPANFTTLARQLIGVREGATALPRSAADREIFSRLVHPAPDVLMREDKRLSEALTEHPLDAELHEEAALLIGSFALRHADAYFYDIRIELSRITAHLAIARALDKNVGPSGELAEAILSTLCGRQTAALEILQRLDRQRDTTAGLPLEANTIWNRALTMRVTGDYRPLDQPEHASLLDRLEYVRALRYSVNSAAAAHFLLRFPAERLAEWSNVLLAGVISVEDGNRWVPHALGDEMEEFATQYHAYHHSRLERSEMVSALNAPATAINEADAATPRVEVLGWGMWAQLHQRQLCESLSTTYSWLQDQVGLPDDARKFKAAMTKEFSGLERFPLVDMNGPSDPTSIAEDERVAKLWMEKPELVPFHFWAGSARLMRRATARTIRVLQPGQWFQPTFPLGTLYDVAFRGESILPGLDQAKLDEARAMAPYNDAVLYHQMQKKWQNFPTPEQMTAQFEAVSGYDVWAMEVVANGVKKDPDRYEATFGRICQFNPNKYLELGEYLCQHERYEAAARAYQKAIEFAPDRVAVANKVDWLVNYYYDHNRKTEAFEVATMAAGVYSYRGLSTMANLCARAGRLLDAETYFQKAAERYDSWAELAQFYSKYPAQPKFADAFQRTIVKIFPKGEEPADIATITGAPGDGVILVTTNKISDSLGLLKGDVVVAVNGARVRNRAQYTYKLKTGLSLSPAATLIVWSRNTYRSVKVNLPDGRLGVEIDTFTPSISR